MSAKWRAIQHRHRYTYNAVIFPPSYTSAVSSAVSLSSDPNLSTFLNDLSQFISLSSIYSQVSHSKTLSSSFTKLISTTTDLSLLEPATCFYLEVLFLENSAQLHRSLVSSLCRVSNVTSQELVVKCFRELCEKYGSSDNFKSRSRRFCLSKVALSVMGMNKLGYLVNVIDDSAVLVAWDVVSGLESVVSETEEWARPSPVVMEQCQESLSCLYYLMQRFPERFKDDGVVMRRAFGVLISVLKSLAFSRDCYVAAGVTFCAGLQVCLGEKELRLFIMEGIFCQSVCDSGFKDAVSKVPYEGDLCKEIGSFSVLSRLCLIRGILTAVSRLVLNDHFVTLNGCEVNRGNVSNVKTILYDGILPELCNYCENPVDSHFNFHALTVMQIGLQQIKTSILVNITDFSNNYDPISKEMGTRVLQIIWNNLEDPLSQTVKQVHLIFDLFLDIQSTLFRDEESERIKSFIVKITSDLLRLGSQCKGRYVPLALLTKRIGARVMLELSPNLLFETVQAYIDDDVCCAATTFLKSFLECLRDEYWNKDGIEKGYEGYRRNTLPPFIVGLASRISKLRSNLNTYALPVLLEIDVDSVFPMLAYISVETYSDEDVFLCPELSDTNIKLGVEQQVCVFVSLLKVCRSRGLIEGDIDFCETSEVSPSNCALGSIINDLYTLVCIKGIKVKVQIEWLALALTHVDELLRVDAADSLFLNPKTSSLPSHLELTLLKEAVPLNMRSCSTGFQMKWTSIFRKFFSRVRTALERQFKLGAWQPSMNGTNDEVCLGKRVEESVHKRAGDLFHFMRWLSSFLFFSCYPSAPYKRKIMAMELMLIMLNVWSIVPSSKEENCLYPYSKEIILPDSTLLLVGSIVDSWDRLRESSFRILLHFPSPLPGISNEDLVQKLISWAKKLVCSPRVRESDAGALTLRLIFRKYVLDLGWEVGASTDVVCFESKSVLVNGDMQITEARHPVTQYLKSLIDWLHVAIEEGERNLSEACKNSFVHGVLLTLRYTFEELDWNSHEIVSNTSEMKHVMEKLLELVMRITSLALWVVSADAWYLPEMEDMIDDDTFEMDELEMVKPSSEQDSNSSKPLQDNRPEQVVMVGCWLAMKEVSLLLGTIVRKIPLPSNDCLDSTELETPVSDGDDASKLVMSSTVLDLKQLEQIGNHFLQVLLKMKHNGAIDKTRAGFTALCNRLLCSNDPRLCKLTESWMEQLMGRTVAKGQVVDDLLRRSAGIPAAFIALFLSEPEGAPKKLLPRALRWLIDVAKSSCVSTVEAKCSSADPHRRSTRVDGESNRRQQYNRNIVELISKGRDEGVIPTVHAFNVLRAAFNDTNLATDTSGFAAEAMILSIRAFSSPYWEIRNGACLAYTALVRRMIGFLNVQKRESARRALTGLEFFHRYPSLHLFLYNELKVATAALGDSGSGDSESNLASVVHPSLCPMLILLSRLKPSALASESGDDLDPFLFLPYIRRCSTQSNLRVRLLASRALIGLVSNEKLPVVLLNIASQLPVLETRLTDETNKMPLNTIHGILLQLCSLLDSNCRNLVDVSKKETILGDLFQVLEKFTWIASPKWCPCPILNASFIRVLDIMLSVARAGNTSNTLFSVRRLLIQLATGCLDMEDSYGLPYYDPTIAELREQAAISYYSCVQLVTPGEEEEAISTSQMHLSPDLELLNVLMDSFAGLKERLIRSLSDSIYEVRLATLKWLLRFLESTETMDEAHRYSSSEIRIVNDWTKPNLQATMMKLLDTEKHHKCRHYILRIIFAWNLLQFKKLGDVKSTDVSYIGNSDFDSVLRFWNKLVSLYKITRHAKTREAIVFCMSICIKQYSYVFTSHVVAPGDGSVDSETLACMYECITFFVNLIKEHSSSSEPVNMRKAAAESIVASGLLEQAELIGSSVISHEIPLEFSSSGYEPNQAINSYAHQVLEVWFTCIKLLEDEDDAIRQKLSVNVQKCISSRNALGNSSSTSVPSQVDKVIDLSFEYLSSIFGHWIDYFDYLSQWVSLAANHMVTSGDLVRRVFDKEIDNHHEEKLLICQICCSYLEKLPISAPWFTDSRRKQDLRNFLYRWRARFCNQLTTFAKEHVEKVGEVGWIGGVGNHRDSFLPVYANLLGIYAVSNCIFNLEIEDGKPLLSEIIELGKRTSTFFQNPMIRNLWSLVLKTHEKRTGAESDQFRENLIWDGFDPYFLRR